MRGSVVDLMPSLVEQLRFNCDTIAGSMLTRAEITPFIRRIEAAGLVEEARQIEDSLRAVVTKLDQASERTVGTVQQLGARIAEEQRALAQG